MVETRAFWRRQEGRPRRRRRDDPTSPTYEAVPRSRAPIGESAKAARTHFLPTPDESVHRYLGRGETVLHSDSPAFAWFIVSHILWWVGLAALLAGLIVSLIEGWGWAAIACLAGALIVGGILFFMRMTERYTAYVITNARMIRMSGVLETHVESIPWARVTDTRFNQSFVERLIACATLNIDSANETAGLRRMRGIADPQAFTRHLTDMIVAKQGATEPLGRESDYSILPPDRSVFGFRKKRQGRDKSVYVVELEVPTEEQAEGQAEEPAPAAAAQRPPVEAVEADPELSGDLSDMSKVSEREMAADRRRQDWLLGREPSSD